MTTPDLATRLSALDAAATPGPWELTDPFGIYRGVDSPHSKDGIVIGATLPADAALIVALRNALPALVELARAAEAMLLHPADVGMCHRYPAHSHVDGTVYWADADLNDIRRALASLDATLGPRAVTSPRMAPSGDSLHSDTPNEGERA